MDQQEIYRKVKKIVRNFWIVLLSSITFQAIMLTIGVIHEHSREIDFSKFPTFYFLSIFVPFLTGLIATLYYYFVYYKCPVCNKNIAEYINKKCPGCGTELKTKNPDTPGIY